MSRRAVPHTVTVVRWRTPDGRECPKSTPGATPHPEESHALYGYVDGRRVALGTSDMGTAWIVLRRLQREHADRLAGIRTPAQEQAGKTITEHVEDWLAAVAAGGAEDTTVRLLRGRVGRLVRTAGWERLNEITTATVASALATIKSGRSPQTRNHYLTHVRQFCAWCVANDRMAKDPTRGLRPMNVRAARSYVHRCPTDDEMAALFSWLDGDKRHKGPGVAALAGGPHRALGYRVAMATGLRVSELRSLDRQAFDLAAGTVRVEAAYSKHRREDVLPLPAWLVTELKKWFTAGGPCWQAWPGKGGDVLQADLAGAGLKYRTADGYWSWHSFRVWYITALASQPGIAPKTLMELARHSTAQLTMAVYARAKTEALRDAVDRLPAPGGRKRRRG